MSETVPPPINVNWAELDLPIFKFRPLPKGNQRAFIESKSLIQCILGGNASGKSQTAAYKVARQILFTKPPRKGCPFWVISQSYEMVCGTAWSEKLKPLIPANKIAWTSWHNKARDWPSAAGLTNGWVLEFKSWEQGRDAFQARSIGGAWFDEQFPQDIFIETFARTRDYSSPIYVSLTPINPDPFLQEQYDGSAADWEFFSLDLEDNRESRGGYLKDSWVDAFIAKIPKDFRDTRIKGKFGAFQGAVFKEWNRLIHVIDPFPGNIPPTEGFCVRGIDFGFGNPFCCLWGHKSHDGIWTIYDEHYEAERFIEYHAAAIKMRPHPRQNYSNTWADPEDIEARMKLNEMGVDNSISDKSIMLGLELIMKLLMPMENGIPRLRVTRNCANLIREMPIYHWPKNSSATRNPDDRPVDKDNHAVDAMRYLLYNEEMSGGTMLMPTRIGSGGLSGSYENMLGRNGHI